MTIGIYKLEFEGTSYVYIGQSKNIEVRYSNHISNMMDNTANFKLQAAYILFGRPSYSIICECEVKDLDIIELKYLSQYNCINKGLNILNNVTPNNTIRGFIPTRSKYSEEVYLSILMDCIEYPLSSSKDIATSTCSDTKTVTKLRNLQGYTWLKARYPAQYEELERINKESMVVQEPSVVPQITKKLVMYDTLVSPHGEEYNIEKGCARKFARDKDLNYESLNRVLNYRIPNLRGWHMKKAAPNT